SRRAGRLAPGVPVQIRDLAGKRETLLRQLRELEDTASKRTPEQLARERYALELETAGVLLALDEREASDGARRAPKSAAARDASSWSTSTSPARTGSACGGRPRGSWSSRRDTRRRWRTRRWCASAWVRHRRPPACWRRPSPAIPVSSTDTPTWPSHTCG